MRRRNPGDENLRRLERAAAQGDVQAQAALERARLRTDAEVHVLNDAVRDYLRGSGVTYPDSELSSVAHAVQGAIGRARQSGFARDEKRLDSTGRHVLHVLAAPDPAAPAVLEVGMVIRPYVRTPETWRVFDLESYPVRTSADVAWRWASMKLRELWDLQVKAFGRRQNPASKPRKGACVRCRQRAVLNLSGQCSRCAVMCGHKGCTAPATHPDPWGGTPVCEDCLRDMEKPGERRRLMDRAAGAPGGSGATSSGTSACARTPATCGGAGGSARCRCARACAGARRRPADSHAVVRGHARRRVAGRTLLVSVRLGPECPPQAWCY